MYPINPGKLLIKILSSIPGISNIVEIDLADGKDRIAVKPRDQKQFQVQRDAAREALPKNVDAEQFNSKFDQMLLKLVGWVNDRQDKIAYAVVTLHDHCLAFMVVDNEDASDEAMHDALHDLSEGIAKDEALDGMKVKTLSLPLDELDLLGSLIDDRIVLSIRCKRP
jgi:hypothetical protein